jgi:uncharacterized protein YjiS (DUF1127 family)
MPVSTPALTLAVSLWRGYRRNRLERALAASLDRVSDQTLKDIGLDRCCIRTAFRDALARRAGSTVAG